ncbi:efflux transporter outer membrane subunit [Pelistega ratti]|uniref:efflux transporter outer membrane subunit n=1 Tax=Pelistega ratti TaxID=2652177 RepID=UPI00135BB3EA|nr:efflux transporter outer membrane subunit [Pelistega ratti]
MKKVTRLSLLSTTILLAACNLAPKYEQPQSPVGDMYKHIAPAGETAADLGWQTFFVDPRLKALIEVGLKNNRDLIIATKNVEAARAQYSIARSSLFPTIGLSGSQTAQELPADMNVSGTREISRSYRAGVGITSYELDFFGRIRNQKEAALETYFATEQTQRAAHINLVANIAEAYFTLRASEEMEQLMLSTVDAYEKTYALTNARFKAGTASLLDAQQARATADSVKASLADTQRSKQQAVNALVLLLGQELPADLPAAMPFGRDVIVNNIPVGLPSDLLTRRPDIMQAEHNLKAANANIGAARAAFFPSISLTGLLGVASLDLDNLFKSGRDMWSFTPSVSMPIFTAGSLKGSLDVAKIQKDIQIATYEKAIQTAFYEVDNALIGVQTYQQQLNALRSQTESADRALKLATLRYTSGIDSFLQVQSAQVTLLTAKQSFLTAGLASLQNKVTLYKALGGGWYATDMVRK